MQKLLTQSWMELKHDTFPEEGEHDQSELGSWSTVEPEACSKGRCSHHHGVCWSTDETKQRQCRSVQFNPHFLQHPSKLQAAAQYLCSCGLHCLWRYLEQLHTLEAESNTSQAGAGAVETSKHIR